MYRCSLCANVSAPNTPLLRHTIYRQVPSDGRLKTRSEIVREIPICRDCDHAMKCGVSPSSLSYKKQRASVAPEVVDVLSAKFIDDLPDCDLCGEPVTDGQVTQEAALCRSHLDKLKLE